MITIVDTLLGPDNQPDYEPGAFVEITLGWRRVDADTTGTDKTLTVPITSPTGLATPPLLPGDALIRVKLGELRTSSTFAAVIPDGTGTRSLFDIIGPAVQIPETTPAAVIASIVEDYLAANGGGGGGVSIGPDPTDADYLLIEEGSGAAVDPTDSDYIIVS